ncbi:ATP-binding protein [Epilithonimonas sp. JDS]|uniref:tetratricopeptide repeat-containing sensor histidine kinase n=1 Tax=Epilithonimonas sp. JDS TaxID=2902797 RepID=UPI001E642983|nr:ATP-binding protein [Epilithonimonas sp. JDS]MCD9854837.1 ATP-binding protein [Epilithonimonas sp. JDS]
MKIFALFALIIIYSCSKETVSNEKLTNDFYDKAYDYREKGQIDSSFLYFYKAKDLFLQQKDSFGAGKCLANLAIIQETKGDYFGSQETAISALRYFNPKDSLQHNYLSINYNTLSLASSKLKNYPKAIDFYIKAINLANDPANKFLYENNLAITYKEEKEYQKAISIFENLIREKSTDKSSPKVFDNLAYTKWLQNPEHNPVPEFHRILKIRLKEKDYWGLNASYSHLADYYSVNEKDSALFYATKMYSIAKEIKSPDDQTEALQKLISLENSDTSLAYFKSYQKINDSLQTARNKAKNQFAIIRYETEKNKADYLKAKAESSQRRNQIIKQYFGIGFLILVLTVIYFYIKRSKKIHQQEKLIEVKNTELKYSKKVHDRVANKVYQVMSEVENIQNLDRNILLDRLEEIYEISRDISYEKDEFENLNFRDQLATMLKSYASDSVKIFITGNDNQIWNKTNQNQENEVFCILQELMTNMKKHSHAEKVFLKFTEEDSVVNIVYIDNGIGIKNLSQKNGLKNTETRTKAINGTIIFDTETDRLLKITISFPV